MDVAALERMKRQLELQEELGFGPQLREIERALEGVPEEMPYEQLLGAIHDTRSEVAGLESALRAAEGALATHQQHIADLERVGADYAAQIRDAELALAGQENRQRLVNEALETAYGWFLEDKEALSKLGGEALTQAALVDEQTQLLISTTRTFAESEAAAAVAAINAALEAFRTAQMEMAAGLGGQPLNTGPTDTGTTLPFAGSYDGGGIVPGPRGRAYWAVVHGGEAIGQPAAGGSVVHVHLDGQFYGLTAGLAEDLVVSGYYAAKRKGRID
jgi:hypothetical protein